MNKEVSETRHSRGRRNLEIIAGLVITVVASMPVVRLMGAAAVIDGIIRP